jgi:hypothetical protein
VEDYVKDVSFNHHGTKAPREDRSSLVTRELPAGGEAAWGYAYLPQ